VALLELRGRGWEVLQWYVWNLGGEGGGVKLATVVLLEHMEGEWEEAQWYFWNSGEGEKICHSGAFGTQGKGM
jgi:hypothetical protein